MQNFGVTNKEHYVMLWYFLARFPAKMTLGHAQALSIGKISFL